MKRRSKVRKRRQRDICKSHEPLQEIPFDLVIEIFTRLPTKSLVRFKSVSKLWSSFISSKYFTNLTSSPRIYVWFCFHYENKLLSSSSSPDLDVSTMSSFVVDQDLSIPAIRVYSISHVYRGLICFTDGKNTHIYNTTTRQLVVLPDIEDSNIAENVISKNFMYCIGHDTVHDQYKVVCIVSGHKVLEQWVFILREGVSSRWRKISNPCPTHEPLQQSLTINGHMYYLALVSSKHHVLVSFDISSEETRLLQKPQDVIWNGTYYIDLIEYAGKIALFDHAYLVKHGVMKLWVIEDEEKNIWSSKKLVLHPSQMDMVKKRKAGEYLKVHGTTRNGDVILAPHQRNILSRMNLYPEGSSHFYVLLYNIQKNHLRKVEIKDGSSNCSQYKRCEVIGFDDTYNFMHL